MKLPSVSTTFKPIYKALIEGIDLPDFWCRTDGINYYLFFANPKSKNLKLPLSYGQSLSNETFSIPIKVTVNKIQTPYELKFKPYQSLMIKVDNKGKIEKVDIEYIPPTPGVTINK